MHNGATYLPMNSLPPSAKIANLRELNFEFRYLDFVWILLWWVWNGLFVTLGGKSDILSCLKVVCRYLMITVTLGL